MSPASTGLFGGADLLAHQSRGKASDFLEVPQSAFSQDLQEADMALVWRVIFAFT